MRDGRHCGGSTRSARLSDQLGRRWSGSYGRSAPINEGLPPLAASIVLASALLHATWNLLLSRESRGQAATAVGVAMGLLLWTPLAIVRWRVEAGVWPFVIGSAALELTYFAALNLAYTRAPAYAVYPVARGLAPILMLPLVALAGGGLSSIAGLGVVAIGGGVLLTTWGETNRRAVPYSIAVALCIAGYTYLDARGVQHADPATYLWLTMLPVVVVLLASVLASGGAAAVRSQVRLPTLAFGVGVYAAYGLTLVGLSLVSLAQAPAVAALRETSILFLLVLSMLVPSRSASADGPDRRPSVAVAAGAMLVFAGVAVLLLA